MSAEDKQKSHERILDAASRLFRERGIAATSVADIMQAAGLTHGGFYRHFPSKEALTATAFSDAVDEVLSEVDNAGSEAKRATALDLYIARYLSAEHVENRGKGCPLAAMGAEIARLDGEAKAEASNTVERMAELLGAGERRSTDKGVAIMAMLLGTITLARLSENRQFSEAILEAGRRGTASLQQMVSD